MKYRVGTFECKERLPDTCWGSRIQDGQVKVEETVIIYKDKLNFISITYIFIDQILIPYDIQIKALLHKGL